MLDTFYDSTGCSAGASTTNCGWSLLCSGGALVADVPPWSVVRLKLAQMLVLDVPLFFMKLGSFLSGPAIGSAVRGRAQGRVA